MAQNVDIAREVLTGVELIARERERQQYEEGWDSEHDEQHTKGEIAIAAACYAANDTTAWVVKRAKPGATEIAADAWPWAKRWDKRDTHPRLRALAIAGALIAAEIDRLQRLGVQDEEDAAEDAREKWLEAHADIPEIVQRLAHALGDHGKGLPAAARFAVRQLGPMIDPGLRT
jgi:hypothetical protein